MPNKRSKKKFSPQQSPTMQHKFRQDHHPSLGQLPCTLMDYNGFTTGVATILFSFTGTVLLLWDWYLADWYEVNKNICENINEIVRDNGQLNNRSALSVTYCKNWGCKHWPFIHLQSRLQTQREGRRTYNDVKKLIHTEVQYRTIDWGLAHRTEDVVCVYMRRFIHVDVCLSA